MPTLIRNAKGHLVTLPSCPVLRHPLTMIHSCLGPAARWGWALGGAEMSIREPWAQLKAWTYLFSERDPFLDVVNILCSTSNPTHPQSLSVWISISHHQPSKISPGPHVARILRHSGSVMLDGYVPTPNRSLKQRRPAEQFTPRVIHHLCLPLCKRQDIHKRAGNSLLIYTPLIASGNKEYRLALKAGTNCACL